MKHKVVVIDGMGGGIGAELVGKLKEINDAGLEIIALGANAVATERMMKAGAHRGASGENAVRVSVSLGDFILGPIGIVINNSLMGEITSAMTEAILAAPGKRILIPLVQDHFYLAGVEQLPLGKMIERAIEYLREQMGLRARDRSGNPAVPGSVKTASGGSGTDPGTRN
jgi:NAD(P)-dependent dehydrogenase (short-subunit alcohol dehydrogenase family)